MRILPVSRFVLVVMIGLGTTGAEAADLRTPAPGVIYAETDVSLGGHDWSGAYAGLSLGYGSGNEDPVDITAFPGATGATFGSLKPEGWLGVVQAGANLQYGNLIVGVEGDLQLSDFHAETSATQGGVAATSTSDVDWYGSLRPRLGIATGPALIYATGGLAFGGLTGSINAVGPAGETATLATSTDVALGYTVGGGIEYALNDAISLRGEYQFTHLSAEARGTVFDAGGNNTGIEPNSSINADMHTVKVGLNFHF